MSSMKSNDKDAHTGDETRRDKEVPVNADTEQRRSTKSGADKADSDRARRAAPSTGTADEDKTRKPGMGGDKSHTGKSDAGKSDAGALGGSKWTGKR